MGSILQAIFRQALFALKAREIPVGSSVLLFCPHPALFDAKVRLSPIYRGILLFLPNRGRSMI
jgi:hypothetical protein